MLKDQRGVIHLLVPLILLGGIIVGVYLVTAGPIKLFPKAVSGPISGPIPYSYPTPYSTPSYATPTYITPYETPYSYPTPPIPSPFSNLSASLTSGRAEFNFTYDNLTETLFKVHLSETKDFSVGVYYNFITGSVSPLIETDVGKMSQYQCNRTLYWQVEAVYTGGILSPIQSATVNCEPPPSVACTLNQFAASFGSRKGDKRYIQACDVNSDDTINLFDIYALLKR